MKTIKKSPVTIAVGIVVGLIIAIAASYFFMHSPLKDKILDKITSNKTFFQQAANAVNKQCPTVVDEMTIMEHCKYENGKFIYQYKLNCDITDIDFDIIQKNLAANIPTLDKNFTKLVKMLIKEKASLIYEYHDVAEESKSIEFSATDLQKILNGIY